MGSMNQRLYARMAYALRRLTTTGGTNHEAITFLKNIIILIHGATPALLDHSTLFQAVEEARFQGNPSAAIALALEEILKTCKLFTPYMILRKLKPPGYLWESQSHAAQAVWLQIARTRENYNYPIGYHIGIQPAWGRPG
eukprot:6910963-Heterocapsa_arctica.AAC.1